LPPELPTLAGVRHSYVDLPGFRAHVAEAGDAAGDPVVLLHGWPQHWWCWRKIIPPLAEAGYRVIAPDLRGHGWSEAPKDGYGKEQFADDLIALLDALGLDRVKLVGHDWGGMTGFLACMRHPDRFEKYVALGIAPPFPSGDPKQILSLWRMYYQVPLTAPILAPLIVSRPQSIALALRAGTKVDGAMSRADIDAYAQAMAERPHVTLGIYRTFLTRELVPIARGKWADRLTVPTRMLLGEFEPVASPERVLPGVKRYADDMRVEEIPGVGHFSPEEAPEAVVERTLAFFA
jgi:pimeloyl-ACP methyl ester carboxylesterase